MVYKFQTANGLVALAKESGLPPKDSGKLLMLKCMFSVCLFCFCFA